MPRKKVTRYGSKRELVRAVQKWARDYAKERLGRAITAAEIAFIKEEIAPIAAPDKRLETLARKSHRDLARAASAFVMAGKNAQGEHGWCGAVADATADVRGLLDVLESVDAAALDGVSDDRTWPSRTVLVQEFGDPRRARGAQGYHLCARQLWFSKREPTLDDLVAVSVLGGLFALDRLDGVTLKELTLANGLDVERRAIREAIKDRL